MARGTVVCDRLTRFADMVAVVAAKASWRVIVSDVIGVRTPTYIHCREDVGEVNLGQGIGRRLDFWSLSVPHCRVLRAVERRQVGDNPRFCFTLGVILRLQQSEAFLVQEWQRGTRAPLRHHLVERAFRRVERMSGAVMAINAIHDSALLWLGNSGTACYKVSG